MTYRTSAACLALATSLVACKSDDAATTTPTTATTPTDATEVEVESEVEVEVAPEVENEVENETDTEVENEVEVETDTEVTPPTCVDLSGGWTWTGSCVGPAEPDPLSCIAQSACAIDVSEGSGGAKHGTVQGDTATVAFKIDGRDATCTIVVTGDTATQHCASPATVTAAAIECNQNGTRKVNDADASAYCCDVVAQDCDGGARCTTLAAPDRSLIVTACVPTGTVAQDQPCTRQNNVAGADDCGAGLFCANFDQADPSVRTCKPLCLTAADCDGGGCIWVSDMPRAGACQKHCDPFGEDCAAGLSCVTWPTLVPIDEQGRFLKQETACKPVGTATEGEPCNLPAVGCAPHLECRTTNGVAACRRPCDDTHACPQSYTCEPPGDPTVQPGPVGHCIPE